jgi:predicted acyltransferase
LVLLGIFYYGGLSGKSSDIRLLGVLQYIGLAGFFGGLLYLAFRRGRRLALVCAVLLLGHWALMEWVPFPDLRLDQVSLAKTAERIGSRDSMKSCKTASGTVRGRYEEGYNLSNYGTIDFCPVER